MVPYLAATLETARPHLQGGHVLPRFLSPVSFPMADASFRRPGMPYGLWMLQRLLDDWRAMPVDHAAKAAAWAGEHGAAGLFEFDIPRLERRGLSVAVV